MRILLVEDEERITKALAEALMDHHYVVDVVHDGQMGWEFAESAAYDVIILDVMLPRLNGIEFCQRLRQQGKTTPVLMLTAKDTSADKVLGLDVGADDYVIKPFDLQELLARVRALLRRGNSALPPVLEWGSLRLDPNSCEVTYAEKLLSLTPKEYGLLELFLRSPGRVLSREIILEHLWSFEDIPGDDTVKTHIKRLRQKLKIVGVPSTLIETVYGLGYRLKTQGN
ncbi:two component transcriptional regulator, winged helix family protein [Planktothrix agardhii CCAP 1459/11A]|jgi:DNA-binding response OmpR family regulator|uniref:Two component transcriptional regulator, winged helix family protein n=1 Tax=Planktothrix agardhii CCAP 1459/11A TaxID=282420 RepID=A0A4P5ZBQ7_PLAAG|nr:MULTISPECIES: response regulator transcription factor [Planktothrix]GDZ93438.1 two component transcriptional regulator, winged helix family protein [Planktothrix agardhii CCAP 1459/11A]CAD5930808.1 Protein RcaC [Planktothrix rubescens]CAH2572151.1 Protein RcaC [Planktothrix rubescens]